MSYRVSIDGWEGFEGRDAEGNLPRHWGEPPDGTDAADVYGVFVHLTDPETGEDHRFWVYQLGDIENWDDWYDYIAGISFSHGMEVA